MALSHKHIAEAVIVILLIGILLAIFIPKFMDAQVTAKVAQAKRDLERITKTVDILQHDLVDKEICFVLLYNDKFGKTKNVAKLSAFQLKKQSRKMITKPELESPFIEVLGDVPVQELPIDMEQDWFYHPYLINGIRGEYHYYGFRYEKLQLNLANMRIHVEKTDQEMINERILIIPPNSMPPKKPDFIPTLEYPYNIGDMRSIAHTPGPVLIKVDLPIPIYDPSNGVMSHGYILHYTTIGSGNTQ